MRSSAQGDDAAPPASAAGWMATAGTAFAAVSYLAAWCVPDFDLELTRSLLYAFFLEFFIVHAGLMVPAARSADRRWGVGVAAIYLLLALGVWFGSGLWTFVSFAYLMALEVLPALRQRGEDLAVTAIAGAGKAALYFAVLVVAMVIPVPRLGVTPQVEAELDLNLRGVADPGPQNVLLAGAAFFAILAVVRGRLAAR